MRLCCAVRRAAKLSAPPRRAAPSVPFGCLFFVYSNGFPSPPRRRRRRPSPAARENLDELSGSVTSFLRRYMSTLSAPRVTALLSLLLESIREREIGSIGALCAVLAAFDLDPGPDQPVVVGVVGGIGGARPRVAAMGRDVLFQLKEMLLVVVPTLNPVGIDRGREGCSCLCSRRSRVLPAEL